MAHSKELIVRLLLAAIAGLLFYYVDVCLKAAMAWSDHDGGFDASGAKYPLVAGLLLMVPALLCAAAALVDCRRWSNWLRVDRHTRLGEVPHSRIVHFLTWFDWIF